MSISFSVITATYNRGETISRALSSVKNQNYKDMQIGYLVINKKGEHGAYAVHPQFNYALHQGGKNELIDSPSHLK